MDANDTIRPNATKERQKHVNKIYASSVKKRATSISNVFLNQSVNDDGGSMSSTPVRRRQWCRNIRCSYRIVTQ